MSKKRRRKAPAAADASSQPADAAQSAEPNEALEELSEDSPTRFADLDEDRPTRFADEWVTQPIPREENEADPHVPRPLDEPQAAEDELDEHVETRTADRKPLWVVGSTDGTEPDEPSSLPGHLEDWFDFGTGTNEHESLTDDPPLSDLIAAPPTMGVDSLEALGSADSLELPDTMDTPPDPGSADAGSPRLQSIVESVLFAADRPMNLRALADLVEEPEVERVRAAVLAVEQSWRERGVQLHEVAGGYQFRTHPANAMWVQKLLQQKPVRLSRALLETLAIVSYRQPITRPEIDEIRGVDSGGTLKTLMDRTLVRILGKKEEPGRPLLYGTTKEFLEFFSLRDLKDLPTLREYHELSEEHQAQVAALEEVAPEGSIMAEGELAEDELPKLSRLEIAAPREDAAELEEIDRLIRTAGTSVATDSDLPPEDGSSGEEELAVTGKFPAMKPSQSGGDFDEERQLTSTYGDPLPNPETPETDNEFPEPGEDEATQFRARGLDSSLIDGRDPDKEPSS